MKNGWTVLFVLLLVASRVGALTSDRALMPWVLGGAGTDLDFVYNGEDETTNGHKCSDSGYLDSICDCSGTYPNGTCTMTANSAMLRVGGTDSGTTVYSVVHNFSSYTQNSGTVTVGTPGALGAALILRVAGNFTLASGATIDMKGKGTAGATGGTCASSNAGKAGGANLIWAGGAAGASGNNAGSAGVNGNQSTTQPHIWPFAYGITMIGTGGGACPVSGQTQAIGAVGAYQWGSIAGTGGGGGGCAASCSGTCGAGGRGGGYVRIEVAGAATCQGTIDVSGANGATGGGGGGGAGGFELYAMDDANYTGSCTVTATGGSAGGSPPTNCGAGAAGGNAVQWSPIFMLNQ